MAPIPQQQDFMVFLKSTKTTCLCHPIVSSAWDTATYNTAKFITKILQNYCGKTSSLLDSTDFIKKIKHLSINPEEGTLVSFDVSALFTSIPVAVALQAINSKISTCTNFTNVCKIPTVKFIKLMEFTLSNLHLLLSIRNSINNYRMQPWVHLSPIIANIYMEYFESLAIASSPTFN